MPPLAAWCLHHMPHCMSGITQGISSSWCSPDTMLVVSLAKRTLSLELSVLWIPPFTFPLITQLQFWSDWCRLLAPTCRFSHLLACHSCFRPLWDEMQFIHTVTIIAWSDDYKIGKASASTGDSEEEKAAEPGLGWAAIWQSRAKGSKQLKNGRCWLTG